MVEVVVRDAERVRRPEPDGVGEWLTPPAYVSKCWLGRVGGDEPACPACPTCPCTSGEGATGSVKLMLMRFRPVLGGAARLEFSSDDCEKDDSARVRVLGVLDWIANPPLAAPWVCFRSVELTTGRSDVRGDRSDLGAGGEIGDLMGASSTSASSSDDVASCFSADM